ncbi:MAG: GNAT family N-acetyltransferase [Oscillospiraceae bacterium]|nr:GNAT family N-acetyltransferase [Oscillospiraceae bacterium]
MNHLGTKILKTDRLLLRPFELTDAEAMYRNWASDPEVTRFLTWPAHSSPEVSAKVLSDWVGQYEKPEYYHWAIVPTEIREPIGSIAVVGFDSRIGQPEVGYCIGKRLWRHGYVSEALSRVIDFLIGEVGASRVGSWHDPRNPGSGAVMRKCGMIYEGTLRQADWNNQGICDADVYAILAEEWRRA